jgi:hypothetical protein
MAAPRKVTKKWLGGEGLSLCILFASFNFKASEYITYQKVNAAF